MNGHWYIVASQLNVRIFTQDLETKALKLLKTIKNPLGRVRDRDLRRKKPGMGVRSGAGGTGLSYTEASGMTPHEFAAIDFAKKVDHYLEQSKEKKNFASLTVAAEAHFMGKLKASMKANVKRTVVDWLEKDLEKASEKELFKILKLRKKTES